MVQQRLTERELRAWRTSFQMLELLRTRIEQQLQAGSGLSNADYTVLALLSEAPDGRMRSYELGQAAGWEKSRMHHQLTRMGKRGLVTREQCGSRGVDAVITAQGLATLKKAVPGHAQEVRRLFVDPLTADELDQFARIAGTILDNLLPRHDPEQQPTRHGFDA
ncbi:MarR family transcriptional regulator [Actinosynnema sp. NPDC047251]|uniref:Transcriptional regulator, MarR family n=1 Tax=Saccharothrix espanaensis (strain ATCC 51144 / DSM 44229 / JCM 9112 / NBRC 15066 / NRRL 15764) TaxID=1179773 RepID=K0K500_SACES|nr:MarR family transcriptional regulator [Saccharothrix espanaensis]CCH32657.1 Transcriptional regulator, MarR family [Saccharothrix espanaensis DSM 44229]